MRIGEREIGIDHPPYVIAEIGVNHDGSAERALELVRLAASAGADAVKFQYFESDRLMSKAAKLAAYQAAAGESDPVEMLRRLELPLEAMEPCVTLAHDLGIHAIVTVFSVELVPPARQLAWDAYKSASPDAINKPLLEAMASAGKPLFVSTGASTLEEVVGAMEWLDAARDDVCVMQCVSAYPTPAEHASIGAIVDLARVVRAGAYGYSDHTVEADTGRLAVAWGADVLEKHLTTDPNRPGPDHAASLAPDQLGRYIELSRREKHAKPRPRLDARGGVHSDPRIGTGRKHVLPIERDVREASRQSLVSTRDLPAGHLITRDDLTIKRPGTGIPPYKLERTLGRKTARPIGADVPISAEDLCRAPTRGDL